MNTQALANALRERQVREGWSDREMGRRLGIDHTTWRGIRNGRQGIGVQTMRRSLRAFPEYLQTLFVPEAAA